jgi:putative N6-adenine-specific DNA methylase
MLLVPFVISFSPVRQYFASCGGGLEPVLAAELAASQIGATAVEPGRLGVTFAGDAAVGARAVLWSRSALRVMELLGREEEIHTAEHLYDFSRGAAHWSRLFKSADDTVSVQAVLGSQRAREEGRMRPGDWQCGTCGAIVFASKVHCFRCGAPQPTSDEKRGLTHSHFSALTVKNAVCDALRDEHGWRPSVDTSDADVPLFLHLHKGSASLYRVLSGSVSRHKRGYRAGETVHAAALRETLAASMLLRAGYDPDTDVLCDPMCGSGTILIEGALMAQNIAPGLLRPPPALTRWPDCPAALWSDATEEARDVRRLVAPRPILANDVHGGALALAQRGARAAGVAGSLTFSEGPAERFVPRREPTLVATNPPWDGRLGGGEEAWRELGGFLKGQCGGSRAWVLSGNKELTQHLRMRASSRLRVDNAGGSIALIEYDVLRPRVSGGAGKAEEGPPELKPERAEPRSSVSTKSDATPAAAPPAAAPPSALAVDRRAVSGTPTRSARQPKQATTSKGEKGEGKTSITVADSTGKTDDDMESLFANLYSSD